jgi:hypothetical protein
MPLLLSLLCLLLLPPRLHAEDALDRGLAALGATRATFAVDREALLTRGGERYRLPLFEQWFSHPLRAPFWERHLREGLLATQARPHAAVGVTALTLGIGTRRDLIPPTPLERYQAMSRQPAAVRTAIRALDPRARIPELAAVPPQVQAVAAQLLFAAADAVRWRELAVQSLSVREQEALFATLTEPLLPPEKTTEEPPHSPMSLAPSYRFLDQVARVDLVLLAAAADDLTAVLDAASDELQKTPASAPFHWRCRTRLGDIILAGGDADVHPEASLLLIDTGGNDLYAGGAATRDSHHPVSLLLDVAGNDTYRSTSTGPVFGAGILGWGMLADLGGDDTYQTAGDYAQGCGAMGVGILADAGGNDRYSAQGRAQGFAAFGLGLLLEAGGDDTYEVYTYAQGCGLTRGFGLLLDLAGHDRYTANDTDIRFPSAQSKEHNVSMCQGAASGERRDYIDHHSLAGGIGMLLDGAGDDHYFGGVFSQAVGYWYGVGILDDRSGNDRYRSVWYGQSATAHFAMSLLVDGAGDDQYTSTNCVTVAAAHDFSASLFLEEGGNDTYEGASAMGQGLNSSVALFVDFAGNDTYRGGLFGQSVNFSATGVRAELPTRALFLDLDGQDTYPRKPTANNADWVQERKAPLPLLHGAGRDESGGTVRWE